MLRPLKDLDQYTIVALDGDIGGVVNFLFDMDCWVVRYFVVATGRALYGRELLISPVAICEADWECLRFFLTQTLDGIKRSPCIDPEGPISNLDERAHSDYFGHSFYRDSRRLLDQGNHTSLPACVLDEVEQDRPVLPASTTHLHSARALQGYRVDSSEGTIGNIEDFIVDDESWELRYLVVNSNQGQPGKAVIIAPAWLDNVDWREHKVDIGISLQSIERSPEWNRDTPIAREYEARLFEHYERPGYWDRSERPTIPPPSGRPQFHSVKPAPRSRPWNLLTAERDCAE